MPWPTASLAASAGAIRPKLRKTGQRGHPEYRTAAGDAPSLVRRLKPLDEIELTTLVCLVEYLRTISACRMHHMTHLSMIDE
jgi:hypothetical protein